MELYCFIIRIKKVWETRRLYFLNMNYANTHIRLKISRNAGIMKNLDLAE